MFCNPRWVCLVPAQSSYFCVLSPEWVVVKWVIKPGLRGILQALSCGEIPRKFVQEAVWTSGTKIPGLRTESVPFLIFFYFILWFCPQNSKASTRTAVVPDIPGFRKILPRSDYIIIPKATLQEDRSRQSLELCVTQSPAAPEGLAAPRNVTGVSRDTVQSVLSVGSGQAGVSEHCIAIEGRAEDTAAFAQPEAAEEAVASEVLSRYVGPVTEKVAGDILLDEASLEIEGQPYQTARVVIEETLVSSPTDISNGSIAVARPQVPDGVSVVTVVTGRVSFSSGTHTPARVSPETSECCFLHFTWDPQWVQEMLWLPNLLMLSAERNRNFCNQWYKSNSVTTLSLLADWLWYQLCLNMTGFF